MKTSKVAIIGSGISGLSCAHAISPNHDVTVFEAADYIGGHTRTVRVDKEGEISDIDTGFIVFNDRTYPNFMKLMDTLGVDYQSTEMSFSVKNEANDIEYNGHNLNRLFGQRRNLFRPRFLAMVTDIVRFNREVKSAAEEERFRTIGEFLEQKNYSETFTENYLLPMVSAIWSMGLKSCMEFPLDFFVRFFDNHGLLNLVDRPQWYTIKGGSSSYVKPLTASFKERIRTDTPVLRVERNEHSATIITADQKTPFDQVVFACHAPQALALLADPTPDERSVLEKFKTSKNRVILHTDESLLPRRKACWASWNYSRVEAGERRSTLTYHMNILQRLQKRYSYLVTLNQEVAEEHILRTFSYCHPVYTCDTIGAQQRWSLISGRNRSHFCGAYWFNGFHEDGVVSGLRVASALGGK